MYQTLPNFCQEKPRNMCGDAGFPRFCRYFSNHARLCWRACTPLSRFIPPLRQKRWEELKVKPDRKLPATIAPISRKAIPGLYSTLGAYKFSWTSSPASAGNDIVIKMTMRHAFLMVGIVPTPFVICEVRPFRASSRQASGLAAKRSW